MVDSLSEQRVQHVEELAAAKKRADTQQVEIEALQKKNKEAEAEKVAKERYSFINLMYTFRHI